MNIRLKLFDWLIDLQREKEEKMKVDVVGSEQV